MTEPAASKPTIYLAECSSDLRLARETLEAELRLHGYSILPDLQLPREEAGYVGEVAQLLEQSKLSIHLVDASYGAVPDGPSQKLVVVLQNELAIERSKNAGLRRVIWLPTGTESQHAQQKQFIETLHRNAEAQFGADLMVCDRETLKGAVHAALARFEKPEPPATAREAAAIGDRLVDLICDERDRKATIPLRKFLKGQGLDVQIPVFEGDASTVRRNNQDLLTQCDAVIVFYGGGDESWKRTVDGDLRKMRGYRGERASYTYIAEPAKDDKKDLIEMEEPNLVNGLGDFPKRICSRSSKR